MWLAHAAVSGKNHHADRVEIVIYRTHAFSNHKRDLALCAKSTPVTRTFFFFAIDEIGGSSVSGARRAPSRPASLCTGLGILHLARSLAQKRRACALVGQALAGSSTALAVGSGMGAAEAAAASNAARRCGEKRYYNYTSLASATLASLRYK